MSELEDKTTKEYEGKADKAGREPTIGNVKAAAEAEKRAMDAVDMGGEPKTSATPTDPQK
ncbi:hypothetical protein JVX96_24195 [Variovorax sp. PDNC026]|uniref:hypothetical protein n=1 Tax=Variovorax sp. PDNC026 TaxID=2811425 RepID=UPI001965BB74|nr:hypothetical protein [Variovorax sp. PDNC026]QRY31149.1 hypothetical protein JVX96_24195 [Variovorax sp. PDNC026]